MAVEPSNTPWLSLLLPTYHYPVGVQRILDILLASRMKGVQCIVGDDSTDDRVELAILAHPAFQAGLVEYHRNPPGGGAVRNWNSLLARATGDHVLTMHHDECPLDVGFFDALRRLVTTTQPPDHVVLDCLLLNRAGKLRSHMPRWLRAWLLRAFPTHLLRHNSVGSPSVWVVRRALAQPFREDLKWLVDVEWYTRMLRARPDAKVEMSELAVVSLPPPGDTITARIAAEIPTLARTEAVLIEASFGRLPPLRLMLPRSLPERAFAIIESAAWTALRLLVRACGELSRRPPPAWLPEKH